MRSRFLVAIGALALAAVSLAADSGRNAGAPRPGAVNVGAVTEGTRLDQPADFGPSGDSVTTFHWSAFHPVDSGFSYLSNGTRIWPTGYGTGWGTIFEANLQVPEGVMIDYVVMSFCKGAGSVGIVFGAGDNNSDFADVSLPADSGCYAVLSPALSHQTSANSGHIFELFVNWFDSPIDGSVSLTRGEVWWHRTVSPGPVVADFGDVPTSDPRYNFIEAIFKAGITVGCGSGNYCPDAPLTRGQMAVFLAKALGLYWPNS